MLRVVRPHVNAPRFNMLVTLALTELQVWIGFLERADRLKRNLRGPDFDTYSLVLNSSSPDVPFFAHRGETQVTTTPQLPSQAIRPATA